jgi:hypothetical protein
MIIESSANIVRADLARLLIMYKIEPEDRIGITCDVVEYLALRMPQRSDLDVFNLAGFVQRELDNFIAGNGCYPDKIERLASIAFAAKLGSAELYQAMSRVSDCLGKQNQNKPGTRRGC